MLPLSHRGGSSPTSVMDAPFGDGFRAKITQYSWKLTDEPPSIACLVDLHSRSDDISCIAIVRQPHVFDMKVVERLAGNSEITSAKQSDKCYLVNCPVKFVSLGNC